MDFWFDYVFGEVVLVVERSVIWKHHEWIVRHSQGIYAQLYRFVKLKLVEQVSVAVEEELLRENVRVFVILEVTIKCKTMVCRMHAAIVRPAGRLSASEENTGVAECTWSVYLEIVAVGCAQYA